MSERLRDVVARNRAGQVAAIPSVCSAHADVLRAALLLADRLDRDVVIEATSNQVNQDGGYTGMGPADFIRFVTDLAVADGIDPGRIIFGGDHLGPQAWRNGPVNPAMAKARDMVADYVKAGFTKIHLDCSEGCAGEADQLDDAQAAARAAELAVACRDAAPDPGALVYVIGTEVPPPGGARSDAWGDIPATTPEAAEATLAAHAHAFVERGLTAELDQVAGLVVQPGVEFTPMHIHHLPMERDPGLRRAIAPWTGLCLEAHSTDYQRPEVYPRLAELGFAFQKVGPALTFGWRQALYGLDHLRGLLGIDAVPIADVMDEVMLARPSHWERHYRGDDLRLQRHFGLADRIRYYWPDPTARRAVARLLADLSDRAVPEPLLWQVFDRGLLDLAEALPGTLPERLLLAGVQQQLRPYFFDPEPVHDR